LFLYLPFVIEIYYRVIFLPNTRIDIQFNNNTRHELVISPIELATDAIEETIVDGGKTTPYISSTARCSLRATRSYFTIPSVNHGSIDVSSVLYVQTNPSFCPFAYSKESIILPGWIGNRIQSRMILSGCGSPARKENTMNTKKHIQTNYSNK
jgi:hypothetical protein